MLQIQFNNRIARNRNRRNNMKAKQRYQSEIWIDQPPLALYFLKTGDVGLRAKHKMRQQACDSRSEDQLESNVA